MYDIKLISIDPTKKLILYPKATPAKEAAIPAKGFRPLNRNNKAPSGIRIAYPTSFTILENTASVIIIKLLLLDLLLLIFFS